MIGINEGYPGIEVLGKKDGKMIHTVPSETGADEREEIESLHICCDNKRARQYMRDKIYDVLTRYRDLDGIVLEYPSYFGNTCYCKGTQQQLKNDPGKSIDELSVEEYQSRKSRRVRDTPIDLKKLVKSINPKIEFAIYTGVSPLPVAMILQGLKRWDLHTTIRKEPPLNYPLPLKGANMLKPISSLKG